MLDKIMQVASIRVTFKAGDQPLSGLIAAFEDIFFPQVNLCTEGQSKCLTKRQVRELADNCLSDDNQGPLRCRTHKAVDTESVHLTDMMYEREGSRTRQSWTLPYTPGRRSAARSLSTCLPARRRFPAPRSSAMTCSNSAARPWWAGARRAARTHGTVSGSARISRRRSRSHAASTGFGHELEGLRNSARYRGGGRRRLRCRLSSCC